MNKQDLEQLIQDVYITGAEDGRNPSKCIEDGNPITDEAVEVIREDMEKLKKRMEVWEEFSVVLNNKFDEVKY